MFIAATDEIKGNIVRLFVPTTDWRGLSNTQSIDVKTFFSVFMYAKTCFYVIYACLKIFLENMQS